MHFIVNDFNLYYEVYGTKKKKLLILPGWGDNRDTFSFMINYLKDYFTVYIIDYPGFGNSLFPNRDLSMTDYANLILDFIKVHHLTKATIIAHSFGGRIVSILKGRYHLPFSKIVLMDIAGIKPKKTKKERFRQKCYKLLKKIGWILPKKLRTYYLNFLIQKFASSDFQALPPLIRNTFIRIVNEDLSSDLQKITGDVLLLWGEEDRITPIEDGKQIEKWIPNSVLIALKGCHHFPYLEDPIRIKNILLCFFFDQKNVQR